MVKKDKKEVKEAVEKVVEEVKAEEIPVEIVKEPVEEVKAEDIPVEEVKKEQVGKKMFMHESGQLGYLDDEGNFKMAK